MTDRTRIRFGIRRLMVVVALTALVAYSGRLGQWIWGPNRSFRVISTTYSPPMAIVGTEIPGIASQASTTGHMVFETKEWYSPWPAIIAMAITSAVMAVAWWLLTRRMRRRKGERTQSP